ncbi:keratin, type I cytoskeletal 9-like [Neltuma alba]|uniref:keratin, type I cytoskeletal 9-like n=1 Tax=Neltuma alba TaxID=207710 RepID=UPI0010A3D051|nr:keratin, type I cytoskeletal 9-like [Prosopis alba]
MHHHNSKYYKPVKAGVITSNSEGPGLLKPFFILRNPFSNFAYWEGYCNLLITSFDKGTFKFSIANLCSLGCGSSKMHDGGSGYSRGSRDNGGASASGCSGGSSSSGCSGGSSSSGGNGGSDGASGSSDCSGGSGESVGTSASGGGANPIKAPESRLQISYGKRKKKEKE